MAYLQSGEISRSQSVHELKELEQIVMSFRVNELQHLLGYANRCRSGKKPELLQRALDLVRTSKNLAIQQKIRELAKQRIPERLCASSAASSSVHGYASPSYSMPATNGSILGPNNYSALIGGIAGEVNALQTSVIWPKASHHTLSLHPDVKLAPLPFYDLLAEVVKPTTLVPMTAEKFQENYVTFSLPQQCIADLAYNEMASLPRFELQLRFCLLDTSVEQKDDFPSSCSVRMNDKIVQLPNPIPTNKVGVEPKRPSRPVNITPYCRPNANVQRLQVTWNNDGVRVWTASVYVVRHVTATMLLQRLQERGERPSSVSIAMIKAKLNADDDNDIATTSLRVSLLCPLGKMRMRLPCRLGQCKHLQCFDGDLFLRMNEKRPTWTCPVCDRPTPFSDIQLDGYFMEVADKTTEDECEVEVYEDGSWAPLVEKEDNSTVVSAEKRKAPERSCASPFSSADKPRADATPVDSAGTTGSSSGKPAADQDVAVIDLTEDDSDDDDRLGTGVDSESSSSTPGFSSRLVGWNRIRITNRAVVQSDSPSASTSPSVIVLDSPPASVANGTPDNVGDSNGFSRQSSFKAATCPGQRSCASSMRSNPNSSSVIVARGSSTNSEANLPPPKKRLISGGLTPAHATSATTSLSTNDLSSVLMASTFLNSSAMSNPSLSTHPGGAFGCGIPLLSAGVDFVDPNDALSAATAFGRLLATANSNFRPHHQQPDLSRGQLFMPEQSLASTVATQSSYCLQPPPLRFGPGSANYFGNPASYANSAAFAVPTDFLNPSSVSTGNFAATAMAGNVLSGAPPDSIWDNRWSQDFQDFLNSCLPDSSSRPL